METLNKTNAQAFKELDAYYVYHICGEYISGNIIWDSPLNEDLLDLIVRYYASCPMNACGSQEVWTTNPNKVINDVHDVLFSEKDLVEERVEEYRNNEGTYTETVEAPLTLFNAVFGEGQKDRQELGEGVYKHFAKGKDGFMISSCQFALHYFFENEDMLDGFIRNVAENIAENGKFILTFMDNINVKKILKSNDKAVGKDTQSGAVVWAIKRNYNIHQTSPYNQKIDVFIENTGRLISENLVDLNILISKLSKYKIILSETETFEETFNKKRASLTTDNLNYQQKGQKSILDTLDTDNNLKTFSFLNRWCIFKKTI